MIACEPSLSIFGQKNYFVTGAHCLFLLNRLDNPTTIPSYSSIIPDVLGLVLSRISSYRLSDIY